MFAAVDLGSNSFRMHVARFDGNTIKIVRSARDPIRLAAGLDKDGNLTAEAIQKAINCLKNFRTILDEYAVESVRVVATNTIRVANNSEQFLPQVEAALGWPIEVISGEEEGRLIYMGVSNTVNVPAEKRLVIDIGGGSTEVIAGAGHEIAKVESFSIGTVWHSAHFFVNGVITRQSFEAAILSARSTFEDAASEYKRCGWRKAYGSSGTIRALSEAIVREGLGDATLNIKNLKALQEHCIRCGDLKKLELSGIKPERVAMVIGGLAILMGAMIEFDIDAIIPIEAGLRIGVMWDLHLRAHSRDRRELAVKKMASIFHVDLARGQRVADLARSLYTQLKPSDERYTRLLHWAACVHEVGLIVSHTSFHKHGAYLLEHADLEGFTNREQKVMSRLVLSQKGNLRKLGELADSDFAKAVLAMRLAVMLLHSKADIVFEDLRVKMKNKIEIEMSRNWISEHPTVAYWLEKEIESWSEVGVELLLKSSN